MPRLTLHLTPHHAPSPPRALSPRVAPSNPNPNPNPTPSPTLNPNPDPNPGTITCSLGARYKSYCSNVGRTYIINPSKGQEKTYKLLLELQQAALDVIRPGAKLSAVMTAVQP